MIIQGDDYMAGSITKRGKNTYLLRIALGTDTQGRRRTLTRTIHGTKADAERMLLQLLRDRDQTPVLPSTPPTPESPAFKTVALRWFSQKTQLSRHTHEDYQRLLRRHLLPWLGETAMAHITLWQLEDGFLHLQQQHGLRTAQYARMVCRQIFQYAMRHNWITQNLVDLVTPFREIPPAFYVLSPAERVRFLTKARQDPYGPLWLLLYTSGLRPSEALALFWEDWHEDTNTLHVHASLESKKGIEWMRKSPKTLTGHRVVPLPDWMRGILHAHRTAQQSHLEDWETPSPWMFQGPRGGPLILHNLGKRAFKPFLTKCGITSPMRIYDLRHTHATMLLEAGVHPRVVAERLGHASVNLTLQRYSHVLPHIQQSAVDALNAANPLQIFDTPADSSYTITE